MKPVVFSAPLSKDQELFDFFKHLLILHQTNDRRAFRYDKILSRVWRANSDFLRSWRSISVSVCISHHRSESPFLPVNRYVTLATHHQQSHHSDGIVTPCTTTIKPPHNHIPISESNRHHQVIIPIRVRCTNNDDATWAPPGPPAKTGCFNFN
jgi:hypothetical protein